MQNRNPNFLSSKHAEKNLNLLDFLNSIVYNWTSVIAMRRISTSLEQPTAMPLGWRCWAVVQLIRELSVTDVPSYSPPLPFRPILSKKKLLENRQNVGKIGFFAQNRPKWKFYLAMRVCGLDLRKYFFYSRVKKLTLCSKCTTKKVFVILKA